MSLMLGGVQSLFCVKQPLLQLRLNWVDLTLNVIGVVTKNNKTKVYSVQLGKTLALISVKGNKIRSHKICG